MPRLSTLCVCTQLVEVSLMTKSYSEMLQYETFEERLRYLMLIGSAFAPTFGMDRWVNQVLYKSTDWTSFRSEIIVRDDGCDLAVPGYTITRGAKILIHHINPLTKEDILNRSPKIFDPENVVCVSFNTHQIIHYGNDDHLRDYTPRSIGDTCPWR